MSTISNSLSVIINSNMRITKKSNIIQTSIAAKVTWTFTENLHKILIELKLSMTTKCLNVWKLETEIGKFLEIFDLLQIFY